MTLLRLLARRPRGGPRPQVRYDAQQQTSQILEDGVWVDSWNASSLRGTKKFDVETGEDAKGQ
jgi:hypothetical protein